MRTRNALRTVFTATTLAMLFSNSAVRADVLEGIGVNSYALESQARSGRATFDYEFSVEIGNDDVSASNVTGTVVSTNPNVVVLEETAEFGDVPEGTTATSTDTISLRVNRRFAFDESMLTWTFDGEVDAATGSVNGFITLLPSGTSVTGATVTLNFPGENGDLSFQTNSDSQGAFGFDDIPFAGQFVLDVQGPNGNAVGSAEGFLIESEPDATVNIDISTPGIGELTVQVFANSEVPITGAIVTAFFPETERNYTGTTDTNGITTLSGLELDGTVIVTAIDGTGASASGSTFLSSGFTSQNIDLYLSEGLVVNYQFINASFVVGSDSLDGWQVIGPVDVVDRSEAFDLYEEQ